MKARNRIAGAMAAVLLGTSMAGYGIGGVTTAHAEEGYQTTYGEKQFDDVTITVELFDRSNAPSGSTITDNRWTKYCQDEMKKVGINLEFVPVPRADEVTKMQTMVASQTAPDLTLTYTMSYIEEYFRQGGVWDLSEFIDGEGQAKNMKAYLGESVLDTARDSEGHLYGITARRATTAKSNIFLRKDWLDELGLEVPTTPDEYYDVIDQMVHNNPDGRTDVIGLFPWQQWNMRAAFSKLAGDQKEVNIASAEDSLQDYYDEGMKDYYQFMNKAYNNGLIHQEYYTVAEDMLKSYIVTGTIASMEYNVNGNVDVLRGSLLKTMQENDPDADFVSIAPLKNVNDGVQYSAAYPESGLAAFCPKTADAETVEACMTYLDWLCSEDGGFVLYHGFEGEHFNYDENGVPVPIDSEYNAADKDWIRTDLFLTGNQGYFKTVDDFNACTAKEAPGYEAYVVNNYENALTGTLVHDSTYTSPSAPDLMTDIKLVFDEYKIKCVTCAEEDFESTYEDYMEALKEAGAQTIIDERTEYYNAQ